jgi:hypothetical protein
MAIISIPSTIGGVTIPGTSSNGPLGALFGSQYKLSMLQYPRDLGSQTKGHYIQFSIYERKAAAFDLANKIVGGTNTLLDTNINDSGSIKNSIDTAKDMGSAIADAGKSAFSQVAGVNSSIASLSKDTTSKPEIISLYMPDTVNFQYQAVYGGTSTLGAMGEIANAVSKAGSVFGKIIGGVSNAPAMAISAITSETGKLALATQGLAINPKNQLLFDGIDFRTYQLAFTFTPYSSEEAETVKNIIKAFRKAAAPKIVNQAAGMFFTPPKIIKPAFMFNGKENSNISKVGESVIESIDVNYAPNGWAAHQNGAPVQTTLTINFKEIQLVDSTMIDKQGF